jgi:hypothetical protein
MKNKAFRALQLSLGLLLFAVAGRPVGGADDVLIQQIEMMGPRQWFGLMAGSVVAPLAHTVVRPERPRD